MIKMKKNILENSLEDNSFANFYSKILEFNLERICLIVTLFAFVTLNIFHVQEQCKTNRLENDLIVKQLAIDNLKIKYEQLQANMKAYRRILDNPECNKCASK